MFCKANLNYIGNVILYTSNKESIMNLEQHAISSKNKLYLLKYVKLHIHVFSYCAHAYSQLSKEHMRIIGM